MIDKGIGQPWPDVVLAAVSGFKQGDLLEKPPIFYAAVTAYAIHAQTKALGSPSTEVDITYFNAAELRRLSAKDYVESVPLDFAYLSPTD